MKGVRKAVLEDCAELAEIEKACFSDAWTLEMLEESVDFELSLFLVDEDNDKIRAYIGAITVLDEIHIANLAVRPEYRGQGLAKNLIEQILAFAKENSISGITLEVRKSNVAALGLYKKYGFIEEGCRRGYYSNPIEDAVIMWKHL